jgi:hypothetical protein
MGGRGRKRERGFAAAASASVVAAAAFVAMFVDGMAGKKIMKKRERDRDKQTDR